MTAKEMMKEHGEIQMEEVIALKNDLSLTEMVAMKNDLSVEKLEKVGGQRSLKMTLVL